MPKRAAVLGLFMSLFIALQFAATNISSCQDINAAGDYVITENLFSSTVNCIVISSSNVNLDCNGSLIQMDTTSYNGILANYASNVALRNCEVVGGFRGIYLQNCVDCTVTNITARDLFSTGEGIGAYYSPGLTLSNIVSYNATDYASSIRITSSPNATLSNITAYDNFNFYPAIGLYYSPNATLSNITAYNNSYMGLGVGEDSAGITLDSVNISGSQYNLDIDTQSFPSIVSDSYVDGRTVYYAINQENLTVPQDVGYIYIANSTNITIKDQTLYKNYQGITVANSSLVYLSNITAYGNSRSIFLHYSTNFSISNVSSYLSYNGVYIYNSSNSHLSNLNFYNNSGDGIRIYYSDNSTLSNISSNNNSEGIYIRSFSNSYISGILLYKNKYCNIDLSGGANNTFSNINSSNGFSYGFNLYGSSNSTFSNITLYNNSRQGFYIRYSNTSTFSNINSSKNAREGFYMDSSSNNTFSNINSYSNSYHGIYILSTSANNSFINARTCSNNQSGGDYYDYYDLDATNETNTTCNTSSPEAVCDNSCALGGVNNPPVIQSSRISPSPNATTSDTLQGFCNATDADGDNLSYYYTWYLNGAANRSGQSSSYVPGIEANVDNVSSPSLLAGQNWTLECTANDAALNSSGLNSSATLINRPVLAQLAMKLRNHMLRPMLLSAVSLDGELITFDPPITFAPAEAKIITLDLTTPACAPPSFIATFNNVTFYYSEGLLANLTQSGSIPLVLRCR